METKYVKVPFDVELSKKISNTEVDGRIIDNEGSHYRLVCFDLADDKGKIIGLRKNNDYTEKAFTFNDNGFCVQNPSRELFIEIPEYMTFKDGDIVTLGWEENGKHCIWVSIIKSLSKYDKIETESYVSVCLSADETSVFPLLFDEFQSCAMWARKSTEIEEKEIIDALKSSKEPKAKECLKMLGIEVKPECDFKFRDVVLVRTSEKDKWCAAEFSHIESDGWYTVFGGIYYKYCIHYNEKTSHLLGTTEDYKEG